MNANEINANEMRVLEAIKEQIKDQTGNQFGYTDEIVSPENLNKHQVAGYIGDLSGKGLIDLFPAEDGAGWVQVMLTNTGAEILGVSNFETA